MGINGEIKLEEIEYEFKIANTFVKIIKLAKLVNLNKTHKTCVKIIKLWNNKTKFFSSDGWSLEKSPIQKKQQLWAGLSHRAVRATILESYGRSSWCGASSTL